MLVPAPLWRRFAAALYDGFLLLGLWMSALVIDTIVRGALGIDREWHTMRACLFVIGLLFFGWFWTHGGQTLGMRAWRITVRRVDGQPMSWLDAAVRYSVMLLCWGTVLTPLVLRLPILAAKPYALDITVGTLIATVLVLLWMQLDAQHRGLQDHLSRSEVMHLPKNAEPIDATG